MCLEQKLGEELERKTKIYLDSEPKSFKQKKKKDQKLEQKLGLELEKKH